MMLRTAHLLAAIGKILLQWLLWGAFIFLVINTILFFSYENRMAYTADDLTWHAQAVIILGSSVKGNQLSQIVQDRAEMAIQVYQQKKADKILISGDGKNNDTYYNEVISIYKYLINRGIDPKDIFSDQAGYNTYDSLRRAQHIFGIKNIIISTQRFHLPRALLIAQWLDMDAQGIIADRTVYASAARNSLRESFARIKAIFNILFHTQALVTNDGPIDISGTGNELVY